ASYMAAPQVATPSEHAASPPGPHAKPDIDFILSGKENVKSDFQEHVEWAFRYRNNTPRTITGVKGTLVFLDAFGDVITRVGLKLEDRLSPGAETAGRGSYPVNSFVHADQRLASIEVANLRTRLEVEII